MGVLLAPLLADRAEEVALFDAQGRTTWGSLDERVDRLVHALRARGLEPGAAVAVMAGNQR